MGKTYKNLLSVHLICGLILLINFTIHQISNFSLLFLFSQILKLIFFISGIGLFFFFKNPFKKIKLYFATFLLPPLFILVSFFFGLLGLLMICIMLFLAFPKTLVKTSNDILLYRYFSGPMKKPDSYEVSERLFVFEKKITDFKIKDNYAEFEKGEMGFKKGIFSMKYKKELYENNQVPLLKDTILKIIIK